MTGMPSPRVAVVCVSEDGPRRAAESYLRAHGIDDVDWYVPRDVDEVDWAVTEGRVGHVIFAEPRDFLDALWSELLTDERWQDGRVQVEFLAPLGNSGPATAASIAGAWACWEGRRRRRRTIAGVMLGVLAVLAACGLVLGVR